MQIHRDLFRQADFIEQALRNLFKTLLEGAGLVTHERRGREVLYALEPRRLDDARAFLDGVSAGWDRALARLRQLVEEPEPPRR